jgi:hypothetical protein
MVAGHMACEVRFLLRMRPDRNVHEVVPVVDGELLTGLVDEFEMAEGMQPAGGAYSGLIPAFFRFGPLDEHFHGRSTNAMGPKTALLGCACGELAEREPAPAQRRTRIPTVKCTALLRCGRVDALAGASVELSVGRRRLVVARHWTWPDGWACSATECLIWTYG